MARLSDSQLNSLVFKALDAYQELERFHLLLDISAEQSTFSIDKTLFLLRIYLESSPGLLKDLEINLLQIRSGLGRG